MQKDEFPSAPGFRDRRADQKELDRGIHEDEEGVDMGKFGAKRDADDNTQEHEWPSDSGNALPEKDFEELGRRVTSERRYYERQQCPGEQAVGDQCCYEKSGSRMYCKPGHDAQRRHRLLHLVFCPIGTDGKPSSNGTTQERSTTGGDDEKNGGG
jgi:hypothetical protein